MWPFTRYLHLSIPLHTPPLFPRFTLPRPYASHPPHFSFLSLYLPLPLLTITHRYVSDWPSYQFGANNTVQVFGESLSTCLSSIDLVLSYTPGNIPYTTSTTSSSYPLSLPPCAHTYNAHAHAHAYATHTQHTIYITTVLYSVCFDVS